jgi:hypothetical protein
LGKARVEVHYPLHRRSGIVGHEFAVPGTCRRSTAHFGGGVALRDDVQPSLAKKGAAADYAFFAQCHIRFMDVTGLAAMTMKRRSGAIASPVLVLIIPHSGLRLTSAF